MPEDANIRQPGFQAHSRPRYGTAYVPGALGSPLARGLAHLSAAMLAKGRRPGGQDAWRCWHSGSWDLRPRQVHSLAIVRILPSALCQGFRGRDCLRDAVGRAGFYEERS